MRSRSVVGHGLGVLLLLIASAASAATPWSADTHTLAIGDFNGDGKDDVLYIAKDIGGTSGIAASDGSGPNINLQSWPSNHLGIPWYDGLYVPIVGDFDNDSRDDLLMQAATPANSYVIHADSEGKLVAIHQTIPAVHQSQGWAASEHRIVAGDFNGDGRTDVFLQATRRSEQNAIFLANSSGEFSSAAQQTWGDSYLGFRWTLPSAIVFAGDFNGDGWDDLLLQAKPDIVMIDYEVPIPVPVYRAGSYGIVPARTLSSGKLFYGSALQIWDRTHLSADWSPSAANLVVGDFNGDAKADILLQARHSGGAHLLLANASGQFSTSNALLDSTVSSWTGNQYALLAANFDNTASVGLYMQARDGSGSNYVVASVTASSVSMLGHDPNLLNNVTPGTAVGGIPGEFSVDPSGGASYSVKIAVPPGVAGVAPDLSLSYSSRSGNGLVGVGFALSGLSGIGRCPVTVDPDTFTDGVDFDGNDAFCLDGARLVAIDAANGAVGAQYRTELETFQKVVSSGGSTGNPASFEVWDKAGLIREYGTTDADTTTGDDTRFEARKTDQSQGQTVVWALKRIRDRFGNFIEYKYEQELTSLNYWPTEIAYGSKYDGAHTVVGRIALSYASRSDTSAGFLPGGYVTAMTKRMSKITVYGRADATSTSGANDKVREYYLNYGLSTTNNLSQLTSLVLCDSGQGATQRCLKDTKFDWQDGYRGFTAAQTSSVNVSHMPNLRLGDMNNDGRMDYVYAKSGQWYSKINGLTGSEGNSSLTAYSPDQAVVMDYDSDGYTDIVQRSQSHLTNGNYQVIYGSGDADGWGSVTTTSIPALGLSTDSAETAVGDFDGDGRQDLVYAAKTVSGNVNNSFDGFEDGVVVHLNSASGLGTKLFASPVPDANDPGGVPPYSRFTRRRSEDGSAFRIINFNGDGRDDILAVVDTCLFVVAYQDLYCTPQIRVLSVNEAGNALEQIWPASGSGGGGQWNKFKIVDPNGDGLSDVLYYDSYAGGWRLLLNTGGTTTSWASAWFASSVSVQACLDNWNYFDVGYYYGQTCGNQTITLNEAKLDDAVVYDYDRDGRTDVLVAHNGTWYVLPGNGAGFRSDEAWSTERAATQPGRAMVVDDRSDGIPDLMYPSAGGDSAYYIYYGRGPISGVVEKITDGLGAVTAIQYVPLTARDPSTQAPLVYRGHQAFIDSTEPSFPYSHMGSALSVVHQFATDNGLGPNAGTHGSIRTTYAYYGLKAHRQGRGVLGFSEVRSWNDNSEIETRNRMFQKFPYVGMTVTAEQRFKDDATTLSSLASSFDPANLALYYQAACESNPACAAINPGIAPNAENESAPITYTTNILNARIQTHSSGSKSYFPYVRKSTAEVRPVSGGSLGSSIYKRTVTEYVSDAGNTADSENSTQGGGSPIHAYSTYGNPAVIRVTTTNGAGGDAHIITTTNTYTDDSSNWCLARLTATSVRHEKPNTNSGANPGSNDVTRTASFTYGNGAQCVLQSETVEPGGSLELTKTYSYDTYGNRYKETAGWSGSTPTDERVSGALLSDGSSSFVATQGQFPTESRNALGHSEVTTWDGRFGATLTVTGPNGLPSESQYDSFGFKTRQTPLTSLSNIRTDQKLFWCVNTAFCLDSRAVYAVRTTSTDGGQSWTEFDRLGREVTVRKIGFDGAWIASDKYYDPLGREYLASAPHELGQDKCWSFKHFDVLGRAIKEWQSYGSDACSSTAVAFNASGLSGTVRTNEVIHDVIGAAGIGTVTIANSGDTAGYASKRVAYKFVNVMGQTRFVRDELSASGCPSSGGSLSANTSTCLQTEYDYDAQGNLTYTKQVGTLGAGGTAVANKVLETKVTFNARGFKASMIDPDMGEWAYTSYSRFGELLSQTDAKGQTIAMTYDKLGRLKTRTEDSQTTTWYYDSATTGVGKLASIDGPDADETYSYDTYGRLSRVKRTIDGSYFYTDQSYDSLGRLDIVKYPGSVSGDGSSAPEADTNRLRVRHNYNGYGYLASVQDVAANTVYWEAQDVDEQGRVIQEQLGNAAITKRFFDVANGHLTALKTGTAANDTLVQDMAFAFDQAANLRWRKDFKEANSGSGAREEFDYDGIYRLEETRRYNTAGGSTLDTPEGTENYAYDDFGNLVSKGVSYTDYNYKGNGSSLRAGCSDTTLKPHAVYQLASRQYCYDANGNVTSATNSRYDTVTWWASNFVKRVSKGSTYTEFTYGADRARVKQYLYRGGTDHETTIYVGGGYERLTKVSGVSTTTEHTHYIRAGDDVIAIWKRLSSDVNNPQVKYPHRDHLGSIVALTDATLGTGSPTISRFMHDAWGKRRSAATWDPSSPQSWPTLSSTFTKRGFTGHENVDEFGFIHMNGRIYDPEIGKFLSADPTMQFPESTQGFNRYSYAGNNPLTNVDPSGFGFFRSLLKVVGFVLNFIPGFQGWANGFVRALVSGFLSSGGDLRAGLLSMVTAGLGQAFSGSLRSLLSQATARVIGTIAASVVVGVAMGQKFGHALAGAVIGMSKNFAIGFAAVRTGIADAIAEATSAGTLRPLLAAAESAQAVATGSTTRSFEDTMKSAWSSVKRFFTPKIPVKINHLYAPNDTPEFNAKISQAALTATDAAVNEGVLSVRPRGIIIDVVPGVFENHGKAAFDRGTGIIRITIGGITNNYDLSTNTALLFHEVIHGGQFTSGREYNSNLWEREAYEIGWRYHKTNPDFKVTNSDLLNDMKYNCAKHGGNCK